MAPQNSRSVLPCKQRITNATGKPIADGSCNSIAFRVRRYMQRPPRRSGSVNTSRDTGAARVALHQGELLSGTPPHPV